MKIILVQIIVLVVIIAGVIYLIRDDKHKKK